LRVVVRRMLVGGALILAMPQVAFAAGPETPDCVKAETQGQMNECARLEWERMDAELNRVYQALLQKITDAETKHLLEDAERSWLNKACKFETSGTEGGSIHPMVRGLCLTGKTQAHTKELASQLNCAEGDLSCRH
jgi:uncharacterized protein YecT (DUF1311 family)